MNLPEGLCLRYPENLSPQPTLSHEIAVSMLLRATHVAQHAPFVWGYIDKPTEGQVFLIFVSPQVAFPMDGLRYQDQEQRYVIPAGNGRELEVTEAKFGFIPMQDTTAFRTRRRFRLVKGGHPQLVLIHYTRGQSSPIVPTYNAVIRSYPLRPVNEPAIFVMGEKVGQKVYPNAGGMQAAQAAIASADRQQPLPPAAMAAMGMPFGGAVGGNAQAMLAQQNSNMEALERRNQRERSASMNTRQVQQPSRVDDDESADESDFISSRTLALARYKRNHDLMNEVFMYAAFGDRKQSSSPPPPFSIFSQSQLDEKVAKLTAEVEVLQAKAAARRDAKSSAQGPEEPGDVSMESVGAEVPVAS
ncbi:hypothetical protein B0H21DRAFT_335775 [Amylocystis lapponica]|nr:hypothetical protein B0H21DRAFT_335775 [Amylocystis lapponica]